jgi:fucose 4-O-acetylase-like acetyltransferase
MQSGRQYASKNLAIMFNGGQPEISMGAIRSMSQLLSREYAGGENSSNAPGIGTARHLWLDASKGVGIILVVYGHQLRAQMAAVRVDPSWHAPLQDAMIYAFHMPLFFFISGLTIEKSIRRLSAGAFVRSRAISLIYPYVLWTFLSFALAMIGRRYVNNPVSFEDILSIAWKPLFQYWFLYTLFICQVIAFSVGVRHWAIALIALITLVQPLNPQIPIAVETLGSFAFFAAGILVSDRLQTFIAGTSPRFTAALGAISTAGFLAMFLCGAADADTAKIFNFALAIFGIAAVIAFSAAIGGRSRLLVLLGTSSMAIFVLHTIIATVGRSIMRSIPSLYSANAELVLCVLAGLIVPAMIHRFSGRLGLARGLGFGNAVKRNPA